MESAPPNCVFCMYEASGYVKCVQCTAVACRSCLPSLIVCSICPQCRYDANDKDWFMDTINIESTAKCTTACGESVSVSAHNSHVKSCLKCENAELRPFKKQHTLAMARISILENEALTQNVWIDDLEDQMNIFQNDNLLLGNHCKKLKAYYNELSLLYTNVSSQLIKANEDNLLLQEQINAIRSNTAAEIDVVIPETPPRKRVFSFTIKQ